jgi:transposase
MAWEETVRVENRQKLLERRRLQAGRWMLKGLSKAEVARRVGVSPSAVTAWGKRLEAEGLQALKSRGPRGRPAGLDAAQRRALARGAEARGGGPRLSHRAVDAAAHGPTDWEVVWAPIQR